MDSRIDVLDVEHHKRKRRMMSNGSFLKDAKLLKSYSGELHAEEIVDDDVFLALKNRATIALKQFKDTKELAKSFEDPMLGNHWFRQADRSALKIQGRWRAHLLGVQARKKYSRMQRNKHAVRDIFAYFVYTMLICAVVAMRTSHRSVYMLHKNIEDLVLEEEFLPTQSHIQKAFGDVATEEEMWQYLEGPLVQNLFPDSCYSSPSPSECVGKVYKTVYLLGGIRLRQVRSIPEPCPEAMTFMKGANPSCYKPYYKWYESAFGWDGKSVFVSASKSALAENPRTPDIEIPNATRKDTEDLQLDACFQYSHDEIGLGKWFLGPDEHGYYPSGVGYICDMLVANASLVPKKLELLRTSNWIADSTRALFVEMSFYNPSMNVLVTGRLLFEYPVTGGILTMSTFDSTSLHAIQSLADVVLIETLQVLVSCICLVYIYIEVGEMRSLGISYWASGWNYFDLSQYICILISHGHSFYLQNLESSLITSSYRYTSFVSFQEFVQAANMGNWLYSFVLLICTFRFFKYLQVSPHLSVMIASLQEAASTLGYFLIIMCVLMFGFAIAFCATFNTYSYEFRSIVQSFFTLMSALVGKTPEYEPLYKGNRVMAPILFSLYMFIVGVVAFSMFLTIISEQYVAVKEKMALKMEADDEIDMLVHRIRYNVGRLKLKLTELLGGADENRKKKLRRLFGIKERRRNSSFRKRSNTATKHADTKTSKYYVHPSEQGASAGIQKSAPKETLEDIIAKSEKRLRDNEREREKIVKLMYATMKKANIVKVATSIGGTGGMGGDAKPCKTEEEVVEEIDKQLANPFSEL